MKRLMGWLAASCVLVLAGWFAWTHRQRTPLPAVAAEPVSESVSQAVQPTYTEAQEAQRMVTITGPMADYITRLQSGESSGSSASPSTQVEKPQPISHVSHRDNAADRAGDSPVGTSVVILKQRFSLGNTVDVPFELPPHAATPQLRGTYHAFVPSAGAAAGDDEANVEFLVLNQQQYEDWLSGRQGDALFSAEGAHDQEVNFSMSPTLSQPVKYYLIFRANSRRAVNRVVQADFRIDF